MFNTGNVTEEQSGLLVLWRQDPRCSAPDAETAITTDGKQLTRTRKLDALYDTTYKKSHKVRCVTIVKVTVMQTTHKARRQILRQSARCIKVFKFLNDKSFDKKGSKNLQKFLKKHWTPCIVLMKQIRNLLFLLRLQYGHWGRCLASGSYVSITNLPWWEAQLLQSLQTQRECH